MWLCCQAKARLVAKLPRLLNVCKLHWRYGRKTENHSDDIKFLLVLDFEATCEETNKITQEIIEMPCLKVNAVTYNVEATFHEYVRPIHPLSTFCVQLTGILQEMVDASDPFPAVLQRFETWRRFNDLTEKNSVYVTSGDWDLGLMLPAQCHLVGLTPPSHCMSWIDLKKLYARQMGQMPKSLIEMIRKSGLQFQGRQHSGIDDCVNIANVLRYLGKGRYLDLRPTSSLRRSSTAIGYKLALHPS